MTIELFNKQIFKEDNIQQNWYKLDVNKFLLKPQKNKTSLVDKRAVGITFPLNYDKNKKYFESN